MEEKQDEKRERRVALRKSYRANKIKEVGMSVEEEKMIKLAIRNSLIESKNTMATLDDIEPVKVYYPTTEEFYKPFDYIESLYQAGAAKYGIIKIVPPKDFNPVLAFDFFSA